LYHNRTFLPCLTSREERYWKSWQRALNVAGCGKNVEVGAGVLLKPYQYQMLNVEEVKGDESVVDKSAARYSLVCYWEACWLCHSRQ